MKRLIFFLPLLLMLLASVNVEAKKKKYPNGDYYEGEWKGGKPNGKGKMVFANGNTYEGEWNEGKKVVGKLSLPNNDIFEGEWNNNDGKGIIYYNNNDKYTGEWKDLVPHGNGCMIYSDNVKKEGKWIAGSFDYGKETKNTLIGICKINHVNGVKIKNAIVEINKQINYVGEVMDYLPSGTGKIIMGTYTIQGEFKDGFPTKQGIIKSSSINTPLPFIIKDSSLIGSITYSDNTIEEITYENLNSYERFYNWVNITFVEKIEKREKEIEKIRLEKEKELYAKNLKTYRNENYDLGEGSHIYRPPFNFGDVEYQYYTRDGVDVYHGTYRLWNGFSRYNPEFVWGERFSVKGKFKHGEKDGIWLFEVKSRKGQTGRITAHYENGELNGICTLEFFDPNGSLFYKNQANLKNGIWDKKNSTYYYYDNRDRIERKVSYNTNGEIEGEVYMRMKDVELKETYNNGRVLKSEMRNIKKNIVLTPQNDESNFQKMWKEIIPYKGEYKNRLTELVDLLNTIGNKKD